MKRGGEEGERKEKRGEGREEGIGRMRGREGKIYIQAPVLSLRFGMAHSYQFLCEPDTRAIVEEGKREGKEDKHEDEYGDNT